MISRLQLQQGTTVTHFLCHETTARAARLEQGFPVTLMSIEFVELQDGLGSQLDVVLVVATLPQVKGQRGCVRVEAW